MLPKPPACQLTHELTVNQQFLAAIAARINARNTLENPPPRRPRIVERDAAGRIVKEIY